MGLTEEFTGLQSWKKMAPTEIGFRLVKTINFHLGLHIKHLTDSKMRLVLTTSHQKGLHNSFVYHTQTNRFKCFKSVIRMNHALKPLDSLRLKDQATMKTTRIIKLVHI
jgi:hypothetical protein